MKAVPFIFVLLLPWTAVAQEKAAPAKLPQDLRQRLQDGLFEEEANRNLEKASEAYEGLLSAYENDRKFAATALFRLGEIRVKQNRKEDAIALFQRVIAEFGSDPLAKLSRDRLAFLGGEVPKAGEGMPNTQEEREIARLQDLVKNSPDLLNAVDGGNTPLARAAMEGWLKAASFLMDHGVNPKSKHGEEALRLAAATGRKAMVELLLSRGVGVNARDEDHGTALMRAVEASHVEVTRVLLNHGASPNIGTKFNASPLHAACLKGDLELVRMLLEKGADLNVISTASTTEGSESQNVGTPLMAAIRAGHRPVIGLLLERNADVHIEVPLKVTALRLAVERNDRETTVMLLEHGAKPTTPYLYGAVRANDAELVRLFVKHGVNINGRVDELDHTPLHMAIGVSKEMVELLLELGAQPNANNKEGDSPLRTALDWFSQSRAPSTAAVPVPILRSQAESRVRVRNINSRRVPSGETTSDPKSETFEICKLLVAKGADVNAKNNAGWSILHWAMWTSEVPLEVADWLLEKGADPQARSPQGLTPGAGAPFDRQVWLEERTLIPDLLKQSAIHTILRFDGMKDAKPDRLEPVSSFDLPPPADEVIRRAAASDDEVRQWYFELRVYRLGGDGKINRATTVNVHNQSVSEDLPQLRWGDVLVAVQRSQGQQLAHRPERRRLREWRPEQKTPQPGTTISVQIGTKDAKITMREGLLLPNPSTSETPEWNFSDLVKAITASEPRADLGAVKIQRTVDSKPKEWTADLRPEKPGQEVKILAARLGDGDRIIIPLKPENDPAALANRKAGVFRQTAGLVFGERVFPFAEKDDAPRTLGDVIAEAYSGNGIVIPNPDLSKIRIRRLKDDTGAEETLEVNLAERIETISAGTLEEDARKRDIPLKPGDIVEWASKTDRPVTEWTGLDGQARLFLNKALRRDVTVNTIGQKTDGIILRPYFAEYLWNGNGWVTTSIAPFRPFRGLSVINPGKNLLKVRLVSSERIREFSAEEFSAVNPRLQDGDRLEVERF